MKSASSDTIKKCLDTYFKHQLNVKKNARRNKKINRKIHKLEQVDIADEVRDVAIMLCHAALEDTDSSMSNTSQDSH